MAAPKKTTPFSRLRRSRSRKNGSSNCANSNARKLFKSSAEKESCGVATAAAAAAAATVVRKRNPYPLYFTVDDLAAYRRKRVPHKYLVDNLRLLSGKLSDVTEYRSAFRSFIVAAEESIMNWKKKKMKTPASPQPATDKPEPEAELERAQRLLSNDGDGTCFAKAVDDFASAVADGRPVADSGRTVCSETKDSYVAHVYARPAPLTRHPTNLGMAGQFEGASEMKDKYVGHPGACRARLLRRNTTLHVAGRMDWVTESGAEYVEMADARRAQLMRHHSSLELPAGGWCDAFSEYHDAFRSPQHSQRAPLMRSMDNLQATGEMELQPEYASQYVDFHAAYPQLRYRQRRLSLVEAQRSNMRCQLKDAQPDGTCRPLYSPEYKHSYVRFPAHRPVLQRPRTHLVPTAGLGQTESELKFRVPKTAGDQRPAGDLELDGGEASERRRRRRRRRYAKSADGTDEGSEKSFNVLLENGTGTGTRTENEPQRVRKNVNFSEEPTCRPSETTFRKGKRLPVSKCASESGHEKSSNSETRPSFRLEVTNPDQVQKPFRKQRPDALFVVVDENNNSNQWIKNKQNRKCWTPSWMKV